MIKLKYDNFMRLSEKEKCIRYKDMNSYDRRRSRMTEPMKCSMAIGYIELTEVQKKKGRRMIEKVSEAKNDCQ